MNHDVRVPGHGGVASIPRLTLWLYCLASGTACCFWAAPAAEPDSTPERGWTVRAVLAPRRQATLSSEVGYRVTKIHREMGEAFSRGDPLITFDDKLARAGERSARAALVAAEASLASVASLYEKNNASQVELETARRDQALAAARFETAEQELAACAILAPFSGRVAEVLIHEHELAARGARLLTIVDDNVMLAKFLLPESAFNSVKVGDLIRMAIPAAGKTMSARISHIAATLDPASRTFDVWAEIGNDDGELRAGMIAVADEGIGNEE